MKTTHAKLIAALIAGLAAPAVAAAGDLSYRDHAPASEAPARRGPAAAYVTDGPTLSGVASLRELVRARLVLDQAVEQAPIASASLGVAATHAVALVDVVTDALQGDTPAYAAVRTFALARAEGAATDVP